MTLAYKATKSGASWYICLPIDPDLNKDEKKLIELISKLTARGMIGCLPWFIKDKLMSHVYKHDDKE